MNKRVRDTISNKWKENWKLGLIIGRVTSGTHFEFFLVVNGSI